VLSGATTFYEGKLDLSTYEEKDGAYFAVTCKVGEIGVKTTFNNRVETEIDINTTKTISGANLAHNPTWKNIFIPSKTINYKNELATEDITTTEATAASGRYHLPADSGYHFISLNLAKKTTINEFGEFSAGFADIADQITPQTTLANEYIDDYYQPIFSREEMSEFKAKYGENATYNFTADVSVELSFESDLFPTTATYGVTYTYTGKYSAALVLLAPLSKFGNPFILAQSQAVTLTNSNATTPITMRLQANLQSLQLSRLTLGIILINQTTYHTSQYPTTEIRIDKNYQTNAIVRTLTNGSISMNLDSRINEVAKADMLPVHEALNKVVEAISDNALSVKSNYYGRFDSVVNPLPTSPLTPIAFGDGSLKAISTGYRIRAAKDPAGNSFESPISFKDFIESLDAIDCIGWGFTTENGQTCLRVEKWDYFYNNTLVLTIDNPNKITRSLDNDRIITELSVGYKKYANSDEVNSFEAIHSEHTYNNKCKALSKQKKKLCGFIADVYSIEETRRKQFQNDTTDFKYDENFFLFELGYLKSTLISGSIYGYIIPTRYVTSAQNLRNAAEWYNMRITPHRNASRWQQYLKWINNNNEFSFVSGKLNTQASFDNTPPNSFLWTGWLLPVESQMHNAEKADLKTLSVAAKTRKEIVSITYPLTLAQYQSLRVNPYGLIRVDSVDYWLQEASYKLKTGETELKLIPKNN